MFIISNLYKNFIEKNKSCILKYSYYNLPSMVFNTEKTLIVKIKSLGLYDSGYDLTTFIYNGKKYPFVKIFRFPLPLLHDILFNEITVAIYRIYKGKRKIKGFFKIKLNQFLENQSDTDFNQETFVTYDIKPLSEINKSDYWEKEPKSVGKAVVSFRLQDSDATKNMHLVPDVNNLFNYLTKDNAQIYRVAYEIFLATQKGTFMCRIHWMFGLISVEYYYNYVYGVCKNDSCFLEDKYKNKDIDDKDKLKDIDDKDKILNENINKLVINSQSSGDETDHHSAGCDNASGDSMNIDSETECIIDQLNDNYNKDDSNCTDNGEEENKKSKTKINSGSFINDGLINYIKRLFQKIPDVAEESSYSESTTVCEVPFCKKSYSIIESVDKMKEALRFLQYSAASFANSIVIWGVDKPRNMTNIKDSRKKSILDRLDIAEEDFFMDYRGDSHSLSFIAFFSATEDNSLIISFKGTTSGIETLHDLNCDYTEFQDGFAHRGIKELSDKFIKDSWPLLEKEMHRRNVKKLSLTGHSLGAAASVLVYLRFQEMGISEGKRVIAFGAPPVVSTTIAKRKFDAIKIYFYDKDIISRLSFGSVLDLKYTCISISSLKDFFIDKEAVVSKIVEIKNHIAKENLHEKLYHVGELIHIRNFGKKNNPEYLYKRVDYKFFEELILSRKGPFDHMLPKTFKAFTYTLSEFYKTSDIEK